MNVRRSFRGVAAVAAALAALLAISAPATAFEPLATLLRAIPTAAETGGRLPSFDFGSPSLQAGWPVRTLQTAVDTDMTPALLDRQLGLDAVGIAFPDLDGLLRFGEPPETVLYLYGAAIDPAAMRAPLLARPGMTEAREGAFATFAVGADYTVDFAGMDDGYPFGRGFRAHRIAVRPGWAAVAFATPVLSTAIAAIEAQDAGVADTPMAAMVEAAATVMPEGFSAYAASGLPGEAMFASADAVPEYGIVVASVGGDWEGTQFLLLYADRTTAQAGGVALDAALRGVPGWPDAAHMKANVDLVETTAGVVAVVTVLFAPGTPDHPSAFLHARWRQAIFSRLLTLAPAP